MCQSSSGSYHEQDLEAEALVLLESISSLPHRLTFEELALRLGDHGGEMDRAAVVDAIKGLKRSGVVRVTGKVVEPTLAALHVAALLGETGSANMS